MKTNPLNIGEQLGHPSGYSCPDCGGVLWEIQDGNLLRFRCRTGHAFSIESVLDGQTEALEGALCFALKTLEERASLSQRMAQQACDNGSEWLARAAKARGHESELHAATIRTLLERMSDLSNDSNGPNNGNGQKRAEADD